METAQIKTITIKANNPDIISIKEKVVKNLLENVSDSTFIKIADKIAKNPKILTKLNNPMIINFL